MATDLDLAEALQRLQLYQSAYRRRYAQAGMVVEFRLLSVCEIDKLPPKLRDDFGVELIEDMPIEEL